jgi:iron complex outermembrane recepter protein
MPTKSTGWRCTGVAGLVAMSCGTLSQVEAASQQDPRTLEEVMVTAQRREEKLQDVPISISVMDGAQLDSSTVEGISEALSRVPGVSVSDIFLGGGTQLSIRGVTASLALFQGASPIAYYLDTVPFGFVKTAIVPDPNAYDLERVEVLRGPQGTLYGSSALNGVVRVLTKDANPEQFEFKGRALASSTEGGGANYRGDTAVNVPLIGGKLAARAVLGYQRASGWIDKPFENRANDSKIRDARIKLNAQPTNELTLGLSAWFSRDDFGAPSTSFDNGRNDSTISEPASMDYDAFGFQVGYDFEAFSLTSNTSYIQFTNESGLDLRLADIPPIEGMLTTKLHARTFAEEVALNSRHEGPWRWTVGGIYRDSTDNLYQFDPAIYLAPTDNNYLSKSYAVFGELTRAFMDGRFELTAGLRYFEDDVGLRERSRFIAFDELISRDQTFSATTPRLVLTWHPNESATLYASFSQGFRSGSDQEPTVVVVAAIPPTKPDKLTNYEVGAKGALFDGVLAFETAVYFIDWQDVQLPITVTLTRDVTSQTIINGQSASGLGIDLGLVARPMDGLELGVNVSWNDLTVDGDVISNNFLLFPDGGRLAYSPEYTIGASSDYSFMLGSTGYEGRFSASANYTSVRGEAMQDVGFLEGDSMVIGRTSFAVRSPARWTTTLFVDNVNNETGTPVHHIRPDWSGRVRPRTYGLQLEYAY